jgi:uncharacterized membrane protein YeaQ/YmgE (transglycosylase-associated protein family)
MGDIIVTICLGFLSGLVARTLHPGKDDMGILMTVVLGIAGSILAQWLGFLLGIYQKGSTAGFLASIIGAILLLFIYGQIQRAKQKAQSSQDTAALNQPNETHNTDNTQV